MCELKMNNELMSGLPKSIPTEVIRHVSHKLNKELMAIGKFYSPHEIKADTIDVNLEELLMQWISNDDSQSAFRLGQIYFEKKNNEKAWDCFKISNERFNDARAKFQLGVMLYDEIVDESFTKISDPKLRACDLFEEIMTLPVGPESPAGQKELVYYAAYNLGRAYHQGFGPYPSTEKALKYFLFAAHDGDPKASILAQTALGYLYAGPDFNDLQKSFYWHTEACGNGSVESQAAIGVMYLYGLGVKENVKNALYCLSEASERGSLYARANLIYLYYKHKMFTNACYLASKMVLLNPENIVYSSEECLQTFQYRALAMACFIYALCLQNGKGVSKDQKLAKELFAKSIEYDTALAVRYQRLVITGDL